MMHYHIKINGKGHYETALYPIVSKNLFYQYTGAPEMLHHGSLHIPIVLCKFCISLMDVQSLD